MPLPRQIRSLVATLAALFVLCTLLIAISPRLRERAAELSGGIGEQHWSASRSVLGQTVDSVLAMVSGYTGNNTYMFGFVVVACVLFVLMVRT